MKRWKDHVAFVEFVLGPRWQDTIIVVLQTIFIIAMIPTILGPEKPDFYTALLTAGAVSVFVYIYATLYFWRTVFFTSILAIEWWVLTIQTF